MTIVPRLPDNAPFSLAQRAWLDGFIAGLTGWDEAAEVAPAPPAPAIAPVEEEDFPWHDPALSLDERLALAAGRRPEHLLMAAMAQLDCGQCGYLCRSYAEALADGREGATSLCVPGAKPTARLLKQLMAAAPAVVAPVAAPAKPAGRPIRVASATALTQPGSSKDVRHVVIDLAGSGLTYEPGDSIGLAAPNDPALVEATLAALGATGDEPVPCPDGVSRPLRAAFTSFLDIAHPLDRTTDLLAMSAKHPSQADLLRRLSDGVDGTEPADADLLDLLTAFPSSRPRLADLAASLPALRPRLYSIASSPRATPGQVHLCVAIVRDTRRGRVRHGVGSAFLADRAAGAEPIEAYVQTSHFRLPADPSIPVIMVGPGTGIAPFRAFLAERAAAGIKGRTWLFLGERTRAADFLYEPELSAWLKDGTLSRIETAFSRDQGRKVYVQDRMKEHAEDLWRWLQDGAHFYVCGDASRQGRYLRDVY
jgi:sulfite reductase (NADPH) flavoprotein alpha-component